MKKIVFVLTLILSLNCFAQHNVDDKIKQIENNFKSWENSEKAKKWTLEERMKYYNVNAVSIAVIKDYKIEWAKAYGYADVSENKPATTETLFQAASISKSINSLGILKLVQEGKLQLNDDINNYLKSWKFPYDSISKGKKITIANLLSHQAGLSAHGFRGYTNGEKLPTTIETLNGKKPANSDPVRSLFEPGLKYKYSGGGTTITQLILENNTGEKYADYMWKNVLTPLGMTNSSYNQPPNKDKKNVLATAYAGYGKEVKGKYHVYPEKAAAGLWTNPTDLAKYIIETQLSLQGKSNKILSKEMSAKRLDNQFGVFIQDFDGVKYFGHSGSNEGFTCDYTGSLEDGNGVVIMTNSGDGSILGEILCSIAYTYKWKNAPVITDAKESIARTIREKCLKNIDEGIAYYYQLKKDNKNDYTFSDERELNVLGYNFLSEQNTESALKIFDLNVKEFPNSSNAYDSRGEVYFNKKEYAAAKKDYQKSLELDASNSNAVEMIKKIDEAIKK